MTKDEHTKYIRTLCRMRLFAASMFVGECVAALVLNDRTWLYIALIPLVAIAVGTVIIEGDKHESGDGE